ncbi:uncharacterized protein LOC127280270 [Leptopilina boulardi]|uniref:uncharacterized protein LOC127280270 n=1 Tax=Leptopilina boulardi TaxID=63433 RepID=UPI0021F65896|nr:uncharacterized protein LOC127280270 [Leptopilina boulardi]
MKLTIFLSLLLPKLILSLPYTNTPLNHTSGILYDKKGIAKISNSKLTLLAHINFTHLNDARIIVVNNAIQSQYLCKKLSDAPYARGHVSFHCERAVRLIFELINEINRKNEILQQLTTQLSIRQRRGLMNGVSYAVNWLFGIPDADDAEYYSENIHKLINDNIQVKTLLKSQIQVVSNTIKNFNNSLYSLKSQEEILNSNSEKINNFMSNTNIETSVLQLETLITFQTSTILELSNKISRDYSEYIDAINLAKYNILSPLIITPNVLLEELNKYHGEYELLITPDEKHFPMLYKLLKVDVFHTSKITIFSMQVPLISKMYFDLYHLIPLPIQHSNSSIFSYIVPKYQHLLLSQSKLQFLSLEKLSDCIEYLKGKYVCFDAHVTQVTDQPECEVRLLLPHTNQLPDDCQIKTTKAIIETWKYAGYNQWFYVLQRPTTLTIICSNSKEEITDVILYQTGLLKLQDHCKGYTNRYALETTNFADTNITFHIPNITIIQDDCCIRNVDIKHIESIPLKPIHLTNIDLSDLTYSNKKLNELDEIINKHINEPFIVTHTKWYTIVLAMIGSIILLFIISNCCRWCGCLRWIKKWCCFTADPATGQILPPTIKNFVNCNFDSNLHTKEVVVYSKRNSCEDIEQAGRRSIAEEIDDFTSIPILHSPSTSKIKSRRSTTPI